MGDDGRRRASIASYSASMDALVRLFREGTLSASELRRAESVVAERHGLSEGSPFRRKDLISGGRKSVHMGEGGRNDG